MMVEGAYQSDYSFYEGDHKHPPMQWESYRRYLLTKWEELLSNSLKSDEKQIQQFFEKHPCMLPWSFDFFSQGAHGIWPSTIISQPVLPSYNFKKPDFMYITMDSSAVVVLLIEIESSTKHWCTEKGQPCSGLTQARYQIDQWRSWLSEPSNLINFKKFYKIHDEMLETRQLVFKYFLIIGRRSEATRIAEFAKTRYLLQKDDEKFMTYDRLKPSYDLSNCFVSKVNHTGYKVISISPTFVFMPTDIDEYRLLGNITNAINNCEYLDALRKAFLTEKFESLGNSSN